MSARKPASDIGITKVAVNKLDNYKNKKNYQKRNFEEFLYDNKITISLLLVGAILLGAGFLLIRDNNNTSEIEILENLENSDNEKQDLVVEIAGAVEKPGVYRLESQSRVEDLLITSGGLSADADRLWVEKMVNRAAKLQDGDKIYIPRQNEQTSKTSANNNEDSGIVLGNQGSDDQNLININTATQKELESLWGIGPITAQNIIEQRPYSTVKELLTKKVLKTNIYEMHKNRLTVY